MGLLTGVPGVIRRVTDRGSAEILGILLRFKRGVELRGRVHVRGWPLIELEPGGRITLGHDVTLNSRNSRYHLNMFAPVKLYVDRPGAEIVIGDNTRIHGTCIHASSSISVGRNCLIAANTQIIDGSGHDLSFPNVQERIRTFGSARPIIIEDNVWVGAHCVVLPAVRIGAGSVIAAGSVVVKDVPPNVLAGGNPARVIRDYSEGALAASGADRPQ